MFQPISPKLDDVIASNIKIPPRKRRPLKKGEVPNYGDDIDDEVDDMNLGYLFEEPVLSQQEKQLVPKPPTYEESLEDVLKGKKRISVDPKYFPEQQEMPTQYNDDEEPDYTLDDEDMDNEMLSDPGIENYDSVEKILNQPEMTQQKKKAEKILMRFLMMLKQEEIN